MADPHSHRRTLVTRFLIALVAIGILFFLVPRVIWTVTVGSALAEPTTARAVSTVLHPSVPEFRGPADRCKIGIAEFDLVRTVEGSPPRARHPTPTGVVIEHGDFSITALASAADSALDVDAQVHSFRALPANLFRAETAALGDGLANTHLSLRWRALNLRRLDGFEIFWRSRAEQGGYLDALTMCRILWNGASDASLVLTPRCEAIVSWNINANGRPMANVDASTLDGHSQLHIRVSGPTHEGCRDIAGTIAASLKFAPIDFASREAISESISRAVAEANSKPE